MDVNLRIHPDPRAEDIGGLRVIPGIQLTHAYACELALRGRVCVRGAQGYQYGECRIDTELWSALSTPPRALQPLVQPESENSPTDRPPAAVDRIGVAWLLRFGLL